MRFLSCWRKRCKTLKAEMETVLAATIQPIVSQASVLAGALENTTRVFQEEIQGIHVEADQTAMAVTRNQEMFEAIMARLPSLHLAARDKISLQPVAWVHFCWQRRMNVGEILRQIQECQCNEFETECGCGSRLHISLWDAGRLARNKKMPILHGNECVICMVINCTSLRHHWLELEQSNTDFLFLSEVSCTLAAQ